MRLQRLIIMAAFAALASPVSAQDIPGTWTTEVQGSEYGLTFDSQGGLSVVEDNQAISIAQYEAGDGQLTITDLGGAKACQGDKAEATYGYELQGGKLSLTAREEPCQKRAAYLDGATFQSSGQ